MDEPTLRIYGTLWCPDCLRALRFLRRHNIPFEWINIDADPAGEKLVLQANQGMRSVPTLVFPDGSILVEPSNQRLAVKLGIPYP